MVWFLLFSLLFLIPIANATISSSLIRFLTPTTYPAVPTTFPVPSRMTKRTFQPEMAPFSDSRQISCPTKRDTRTRHVKLDSNLMREIYLHEVGAWDKHLVAETIEEARENFIGLSQINDKTLKQLPIITDTFKELRYGVKKHTQLNGTNTDDTEKQATAENSANTDVKANEAKTTISSEWNKLISVRKRFSQEKHDRTKRNTGGTETTTEYCHPRGSRTDDGYVHMCSVCAFTTKLHEDVFPRYVNEIGCDSSDCNCFTINDVSYGKCRTKILTIKVLRKVTSGCRLIIHDGHHLITDNWELYDLPLKVGCECVIDKRSPFARLMGR